MTDFYLITGFLGAGKTTLLKALLPFFKGKSLRLIINEFGKEGVDGQLLTDTGAALSEICGGSIFCTCRLDKFEEALAQGLSSNPQVLLVEASGLSDPTNIRLLLEENERQGKLVYKGCICLVDAVQLPKVFSTARVCPKQLAVSDLVLLNKTDLATAAQLAQTKELILSRFPDAIIKETSHGKLEAPWLADLAPYRRRDDATAGNADLTAQRATVQVDPSMSSYELNRFLAMFAEETSRIKGFVYLQEAGWLLADCVGPLLRLVPYTGQLPASSNLTVLATTGMALRKTLKQAATWYAKQVVVTFG